MPPQTKIAFRTPLGSEIIPPGPSSTNLGPFDVSEYSTIRVYVFNRGDSVGPAHVFVTNTEMESEIGTDPGIALLGEFDVPAGKGQTASFPVPGVTIGLTLINGTAARMGVDIFVYGNG
jgi:hypothetical protein